MTRIIGQVLNRFQKTKIFLVLVACRCSGVFAQSGAGSIQGTVTDATGAAIPGAGIHVVSEATGVVSDAKSNSAGCYQVPNPFTGTYEVTISASGFNSGGQECPMSSAVRI